MKLFLTVFIAGAITLSNTVMAKTELTVNCFFGPKHLACAKVLPAWIDEVEKVTEGRVTGIIPPKSVAPPPKQLSAVEKGIADAAIQFNGLIANRVQGPLVAMNLFIGNNDVEAMSKALWETNRRFFPDEFDTVHLLSQWVISPGELFSQTNKPINSIKDMASRKLWALPGPLSNVAKKIGAGVVSTPAVKSNEVIGRGVVDGHLGLDPQGVRAFQLIPYTKSMTQFSKAIYATSFSFIINKDVWAKISPADQKAIAAISGEVLALKFAKGWSESTASAFKEFKTNGIQIVKADPAFEKAFIEASSSINQKWLEDTKKAGLDAEGILKFYKQRLKELSQ